MALLIDEVRPQTVGRRHSLNQRLLLLSLLLGCELICLTLWLDADAIKPGGVLAVAARRWGAWAVRGAIAFALSCIALSYSKVRVVLERHAITKRGFVNSGAILASHFGVLAGFAFVSTVVFTSGSPATDLAVAAWFCLGVAAVALAVGAFLSMAVIRALLRATSAVWIFGVAATTAALAIGIAARPLWEPSASVTFAILQRILEPVLPGFTADAAKLTIGSTKFEVTIDPACSGFEGLGLVLAFTSSWLWFFRREYRFPRALILVPAGLAAIWIFNIVRIATLIWIGHLGWASVAAGGFHSQAGWIAFVITTLLLSWWSSRIPWFQRERVAVARERIDNATVANLLPLLAIFSAALVSSALSDGFERLYPVRLLAAGGVLFYFRDFYRRYTWRLSVVGAAAGTAVFALWIWLCPPDSGADLRMDAALGGLSKWGKFVWLTCRIAAAVITVPIAEELAFRSFLMRRLVDSDFEAVEPTAIKAIPLLISSLVFGAMHGNYWFAGALAGFAYALVFRRRGSVGDAAFAHAVTNALLAVWVVASGHWSLW